MSRHVGDISGGGVHERDLNKATPRVVEEEACPRGIPGPLGKGKVVESWEVIGS
jgi:hypothetical protein